MIYDYVFDYYYYFLNTLLNNFFIFYLFFYLTNIMISFTSTDNFKIDLLLNVIHFIFPTESITIMVFYLTINIFNILNINY